MSSLTNYYDVLGVSPNASHDEIVAAAQMLNGRFPEHLRDPETNVAFRQLVNAFKVLGSPESRAAYDQQLAAAQSILDINMQISRQVIGARQGEQLLYILADLRSPLPPNESEQVPVNLCLVIDRSTSMQGMRLDRVKSAAKRVLQQLSQKDVITVISFSDRAEVITPAGHIYNRAELAKRIDGMLASGGTEIYQGLKAGLAEMRNVDLVRYLNKLVLLTDGHTYGDEDQCLALAKEASDQGIIFSALGIGNDWNDEFLDKLVAVSGGKSMYIEEPDQIITSLQDEIEGLGAVYAHKVQMTLSLPAGVTLKYAMKLSPFAQPLSTYQNRIELGAIEGRSPLTILMEISVRQEEPGRTISIPLKVTVDIPSKGLRRQQFERLAQFSVVTEEPHIIPPPTIIRAVQMLNLHRMNEKVWFDVENGQLDKATQRMRRLSTRLMESGHSDLAYDALVETQRLARMGTLSLEGRKKLKFGTRSLLTNSLMIDKQDEV